MRMAPWADPAAIRAELIVRIHNKITDYPSRYTTEEKAQVAEFTNGSIHTLPDNDTFVDSMFSAMMTLYRDTEAHDLRYGEACQEYRRYFFVNDSELRLSDRYMPYVEEDEEEEEPEEDDPDEEYPDDDEDY